MASWKVICDTNIRSYWKCPECNEGVVVYLNEYQDIGTPICSDCDCDMEYIYTEVKLG